MLEKNVFGPDIHNEIICLVVNCLLRSEEGLNVGVIDQGLILTRTKVDLSIKLDVRKQRLLVTLIHDPRTLIATLALLLCLKHFAKSFIIQAVLNKRVQESLLRDMFGHKMLNEVFIFIKFFESSLLKV
jgi:hypothetical protein